MPSTTSNKSFNPIIQELVCWTRMQTEAGEGLRKIIGRKEIERRNGNGTFFWGVGNPPSVTAPFLARLGTPVSAVFSIMKSRPKAADIAPQSLLVWRQYFDAYGQERELPPHVLVTSRGDTGGIVKRRHYALICYSEQPIMVTHGIRFDPSAYRNARANGGPVGASQVTALLRKIKEPVDGDYEANFTAQLCGSYWVRLTDPTLLSATKVKRLQDFSTDSFQEWIDVVSELREGQALGHSGLGQSVLL